MRWQRGNRKCYVLQIPKSFTFSTKYTQQENDELKELISDWFIYGTTKNYTADQIIKMNNSFHEKEVLSRAFEVYSAMYGKGSKFHPHTQYNGNEHIYVQPNIFPSVAIGAANYSSILSVCHATPRFKKNLLCSFCSYYRPYLSIKGKMETPQTLDLYQELMGANAPQFIQSCNSIQL